MVSIAQSEGLLVYLRASIIWGMLFYGSAGLREGMGMTEWFTTDVRVDGGSEKHAAHLLLFYILIITSLISAGALGHSAVVHRSSAGPSKTAAVQSTCNLNTDTHRCISIQQ